MRKVAYKSIKNLVFLLSIIACTNLCSAEGEGSVLDKDLMKGLAEIDFIVENAIENSSISIGTNYSSIVWGWCDEQITMEQASSCSLAKCPENNCQIFTINGEPYGKEVLTNLLRSKNLQTIYRSGQELYEQRKTELYANASKPDLSEGLATGIVQGIFQGLIIVSILIFFYRRYKKRK